MGQGDMPVQVSPLISANSVCCLLQTNLPTATLHYVHDKQLASLSPSPSPGHVCPTHVLAATELSDGGGLGDGPVHALYEDPVASRHSAHLHSVSSLRDPQVANLKRGGEG